MKQDPVKPNDLITLREAIPQYDLSRGQIGRVLQVFTPDKFEVEFLDTQGHTKAKVHLSEEQVTVLRYEATLDEAGFWKLIEDAKDASTGDPDKQVELLIDKLAQMSIADIYAFGDRFHKFHDLAYRNDLWAAGYIINAGCGDDGFMDFRAWLIAQGEKVFHDALQDPETLVELVDNWGDAFLEKMNYADWYAYEKKTGEEIPHFWGMHERPELSGEDWDEETVDQKYPKLAAKFWPKDYGENPTET